MVNDKNENYPVVDENHLLTDGSLSFILIFGLRVQIMADDGMFIVVFNLARMMNLRTYVLE